LIKNELYSKIPFLLLQVEIKLKYNLHTTNKMIASYYNICIYRNLFYTKNIDKYKPWVIVLFVVLSILEILGTFLLLVAMGQVINYFLPGISTKIAQFLTKLKINKCRLIISKIAFPIIFGIIFTLSVESIIFTGLCIGTITPPLCKLLKFFGPSLSQFLKNEIIYIDNTKLPLDT
jgi:hypothetical protein